MNAETAVPVVRQSLKWYEILRKVLLRPSVETFQDILSDPNTSKKRIFRWMVTAYAILGTGAYILFVISSSQQVYEGVLLLFFGFLIAGFLSPLIYLVFLIITAWFIHLIASWFGGTGSTNRLTYLLGIIGAAGSALWGGLYLLTSLCTNSTGINNNSSTTSVVLQLLVAGFMLFWLIQAIRAEENLGTGMALLTVTVMVSAFLMVGYGYYYLTTGYVEQEKAAITVVLDTYMKDMAANDSTAAYQLFSPRAQRQVPPQDIENLLEGDRDVAFGGYLRINLIKYKIQDAASETVPDGGKVRIAVVEGIIIYDGGIQGNFSGTLEKVDGNWRLFYIKVRPPESRLK